MNDIFTNIPEGQLMPNVSWGVSNQDNVGNFSVGGGTKTLRMNDKDGLWLGAASFADAPFSVTLDGKIVSKLLAGTAGITIDGANNTIIVNDGTNDRILIGYQSGGF